MKNEIFTFYSSIVSVICLVSYPFGSNPFLTLDNRTASMERSLQQQKPKFWERSNILLSLNVICLLSKSPYRLFHLVTNCRRKWRLLVAVLLSDQYTFHNHRFHSCFSHSACSKPILLKPENSEKYQTKRKKLWLPRMGISFLHLLRHSISTIWKLQSAFICWVDDQQISTI